MTHSFLALMGGLAVEDEKGHPNPVAQDDRHKYEIVDATLPSEEQIIDLSKADNIAKVITFIQILWVLIQFIGRLAQRLSISTLEVATVAYIFCATITIILWWKKPLDIAIPHIVHATYQQRTHYAEWPWRKTEFHAFRDLCYPFMQSIWSYSSYSLGVSVPDRY